MDEIKQYAITVGLTLAFKVGADILVRLSRKTKWTHIDDVIADSIKQFKLPTFKK